MNETKPVPSWSLYSSVLGGEDRQYLFHRAVLRVKCDNSAHSRCCRNTHPSPVHLLHRTVSQREAVNKGSFFYFPPDPSPPWWTLPLLPGGQRSMSCTRASDLFHLRGSGIAPCRVNACRLPAGFVSWSGCTGQGTRSCPRHQTPGCGTEGTQCPRRWDPSVG